MKRLFLATALALVFSTAIGDVMEFSLQPWNKVEVDSNGTLKVWGAPNIGNAPLVANPDYGWPAMVAVAIWRNAFLRARKELGTLTIYYDPSPRSDGGHDIWTVIE